MTRVSISYGDIAAGARQDFSAYTEDQTSFSDLDKLKYDILTLQNYSNPCDYYSTVLDGNVIGIPENDAIIPFWSESYSNENGIFNLPIVLTLNSTKKYSSKGILLTFDKFNDVYSNNVKIQFYDGDELLSEKTFYPDSAVYYCEKDDNHKNEQYNKFVVTFYSINMPYNRLKLNGIEYGLGIEIKGNELKNVKLIQEIDPISSQLSINTCDVVLDSKSDYDWDFKEKQPLDVFFGEKLQSRVFVKNAKRTGKNMWVIDCEDYIGLLDTVRFGGGVYSSKSGIELIEEIFSTASIPFEFKDVEDVQLYGYIPYTTCREALMQVCFAMGLVADTTHSNVVKIYKMTEEISQTIPLARIMKGQSFDTGTKITSVELMAHSYVESSDTLTVYDGSESGEGENILVVFSEPVRDLSIQANSSIYGEIIEAHSNYAIINATKHTILKGKKYIHTTITKSITNENILPNDAENVVSIKNATLISVHNVDKILQNCYNHIVKDTNINLKIIEAKHEQKETGEYYNDEPVVVGDKITTETEYLGNITGRVVKQTFNLNGGIIVKDTIMVAE